MSKKTVKELQASIRAVNEARKLPGGQAAWEKNLAKAKAAQAEQLQERAAAAKAMLPASKEKERKPPPEWYKRPKTLGACADALFKYRAERLKLQRQAEEYEAAELALKDYLIETLPKSDAGGISGKLARVTVGIKPVPVVKDWDKLYLSIVEDWRNHVKKKDGMEASAFALLNRALTKATVEEYWKNGQEVPGVGTFNATTVSVEKL